MTQGNQNSNPTTRNPKNPGNRAKREIWRIAELWLEINTEVKYKGPK